MRVTEFKDTLNMDEKSSMFLSLKRGESWMWMFMEESKTHAYLSEKKNAGEQQIIHMIGSKLGRDAPGVK